MLLSLVRGDDAARREGDTTVSGGACRLNVGGCGEKKGEGVAANFLPGKGEEITAMSLIEKGGEHVHSEEKGMKSTESTHFSAAGLRVSGEKKDRDLWRKKPRSPPPARGEKRRNVSLRQGSPAWCREETSTPPGPHPGRGGGVPVFAVITGRGRGGPSVDESSYCGIKKKKGGPGSSSERNRSGLKGEGG